MQSHHHQPYLLHRHLGRARRCQDPRTWKLRLSWRKQPFVLCHQGFILCHQAHVLSGYAHLREGIDHCHSSEVLC
jgi:hypothetical protein